MTLILAISLALKHPANPHPCWILGVSQGRLLIPRRCPSVFNVLDKDVGQRHWVYFDGMWVFGSSDTVKSTAFLTVCHVTA
jgi:hypothetical protein